MGKLIDLTGQRFGRLTVLRRDESKPCKHGSSAYWICKCDCGNITSVQSNHIRRGNIVSCGCYHSEEMSKRQDKHQSREYKRLRSVWLAMIQRCEHQNCKNYYNYGGRGISVCERWHVLQCFIDDMQPTYRKGLQIDRIDNNGNYEPLNCRWVSPRENARNTRKNVWITGNDKRMIQADWCRSVNRVDATFESFLDNHRLDGDILIEGGVRDNTGLPKLSGIPSNCPWELTADGNGLQRRCGA